MKVLYFGATWCGQCRVAKPKIESVCKEKGLTLEYIDCMENEELASKYGVRNIPYIIVVDDNGEVVQRDKAMDIINKL